MYKVHSFMIDDSQNLFSVRGKRQGVDITKYQTNDSRSRDSYLVPEAVMLDTSP